MKPFGWSLISSFALTAAGSPIAAPAVRLDERATSITSAMLNNFDLYAQYAGASYCNSNNAIGSIVTCSASVCPDVTAAGAKITATYAGSTTDIRGFVSTDATNQVIVVSVRGSYSIRNWLTDFEFIQQSCSSLVSGCQVHSGFARAWSEISSAVIAAVKAASAAYPGYKIVFTGHSLGAAVSSLGAAYARQQGLAVDIVNFGSPRVGNAAFATFVSNQAGNEYRVTHLDDPVPRLPPIIFGYAHTTPEYWLSDGTATTTAYAASDVKVCEGITSLGCNAATFGLDTDAHQYYLAPITACSPSGLEFRRQADNYTWWQATSPSVSVTDAQLEAQLNAWVTQDLNTTS